ncbi:hypothetical protein BGM19_17620 [Streptomyces agglomeratus]|uniref:Uncharacterized protein n=1 Tax=Streptomyces agglomeratus TaxID=285458 RepID=A0A1E5PAD2_9ACTN|nr:hypothetical protein [Streptomyces agglomeratus]OEJ26324.1 hypothetical protein AS594_19335 [Streptomyces agglomeratus]OEJ52180.1 hypothetical protein BGK72_16770 [Streptomyces agglomeratus]OEJ59539.1 hypothetical protein BGM19_17620 [Streptomyces agglomeratus]
MGIESDQLVYDYLSRVGDLAQQQKLPAATRMRLVAGLRDEIDRQRSKFGTPDSPAAVRRILGRIGPPAELVARAASDEAGPRPAAAQPVVLPEQRDTSKGRGWIPRPRDRDPDRDSGRAKGGKGAKGGKERGAELPDTVDQPAGASPPHLAGSDELGPPGSETDWWRVEPGPFGLGDTVPGFTGGVEIPEILKPPPAKDDEDGDGDEHGEDGEGTAAGVESAPRRRFPRLRRRTAAPAAVVAPEAARPPANVLLLLAAALLVAGAVLGNLLALGGGWLLAYASRRISRAQAKWAVLGLPGLVAAGGLVWLWGRTEGRWGEPVARGAMGEAVSDVWPVVVRAAAVASALYLVWRARRR